MDGLKIKEHNLSEVLKATDYFRLEADYFTSQNLQGENIIFAHQYINRVQYGTSEFLNEDKQGYPVLRLNEFEGCFIKEPTKCCNLISQQQFQELKLHKGDVLICRTNGNPNLVGRAAVIMEDCNYAFASYLFRTNINGDITPEAFVAYLQSKYGRIEIDKNSMKGNQTNFSPSKLKEVKMPCFSREFCSKITCFFEESYQALKKSKESYACAEKLLEKEIGIDMSAITSGGVSVKSFAESFGTYGRLDAEYYQPKYDYILSHIKSYKHGYFMLGDIIADYSTGYAFSSDDYTDVGVPLIRITNITDGRLDLDNANKIPEDKIPLNCKDYALENDILISMSGSIGLSCVVPDGIKALVNQRIMRITQDKYDSNLLSMMINSFIVNEQLRRIGTGGVQTNISATDIKNIVLPNLDSKMGKIITNKIKESTMLLEKSKRLLECAIKAVEMAIETNEEKAISWLEAQKSKEI